MTVHSRRDPRKFRDPDVTADGQRRAKVALRRLETLWINTGTQCNLSCAHCYIESSPRNDRLVYLTAAEVAAYLDEIERDGLGTGCIGFTGGEPFVNPQFMAMLEDALARGFRALVLTNAMRPMARRQEALLDLRRRFGARLELRVSLDHPDPAVHDAERGAGSWAVTMAGLAWLDANGFAPAVAARRLGGEAEADLRRGFARLFAARGLGIDAADAARLVVFPEMDAAADAPEITEACWGLLGVAPGAVMCAGARMVVRRKGAPRPAVVACTLLPYDPRFEMGATLAEARGEVALNHPHCAQFCVLGGASCGG